MEINSLMQIDSQGYIFFLIYWPKNLDILVPLILPLSQLIQVKKEDKGLLWQFHEIN